MASRLTLFLCAILIALSLTNCDYQVRYRQLPFWVFRHFQQLPDWQYPQKIAVDHDQRRVYWLNKQGEIKSIGVDGRNEKVVNQGIGVRAGVTFISDFTIDGQNGALYFTDLMDINTGQAALKKSDLEGNHTETIATFSAEVPYAVHWDTTNARLYYATRQKNGHLHSVHQLGQNLSLITTTQKVKNIGEQVRHFSLRNNAETQVANHQMVELEELALNTKTPQQE